MSDRIYYVGPKRVTTSGRNTVLIILGKDFKFLVGKKVMLAMKVLDEVENENKT